jgi:D-alanyl-D-alanine dipeptidase
MVLSLRNRPTLLISKLFLTLTFCFLAPTPAIRAQSPVSAATLEPGSKPADISTAWKQLVGIYHRDNSKELAILLERDHKLLWQTSDKKISEIIEKDGYMWVVSPGDLIVGLAEQRDASGTVTTLSYLNDSYQRSDAGADPSRFYHITLKQPLDQLRVAALATKPPAEPGHFRQPDLVELTTLDPAIHLDIRYAHSNNFLSTPVYSQARAFMQRPAAEALLRVLNKLKPLGFGLLIHDAYRPWYVTKIFWDATPPEGRIFVADPAKGSKHNRGCAVDLTLYDLFTGQPIEMPGLYDEMSPRSFPNFPGGTSLQRWHRDLLRRAMESEGFTVNEDEWWHFDYKDWKHYPILNVPFEKLGKD